MIAYFWRFNRPYLEHPQHHSKRDGRNTDLQLSTETRPGLFQFLSFNLSIWPVEIVWSCEKAYWFGWEISVLLKNPDFLRIPSTVWCTAALAGMLSCALMEQNSIDFWKFVTAVCANKAVKWHYKKMCCGLYISNRLWSFIVLLSPI